MDIHKPHAAKTWREFAIEIGTIVCGILIAIALEQTVEKVHWIREVHDARVALRREMATDNVFFALRAAAKPCLEQRLNEVETIVENVAAGHRERPVKNVMYAATQRLDDNIWLAERASQTATHFPDSELWTLSRYYQQVNNTREWLHEEHMSWARLAVLEGDPNRLGSAEIAQLRSDIQLARDRNRFIARAMPFEDSERFGVARPALDPALVKTACAPLLR